MQQQQQSGGLFACFICLVSSNGINHWLFRSPARSFVCVCAPLAYLAARESGGLVLRGAAQNIRQHPDRRAI